MASSVLTGAALYIRKAIMKKYPIKLIPAVKNTIWGGTKLKTMFDKEAPFDTLGETWELSAHPDGMGVIANGEYAGMSFGEYIANAGNGAVGEYNGDRFPLLIKFLDANDKLSIQVHPDNEYALANENEFGKTEMWYILSADEGANIVYGLKDGITCDDFKTAVENGTVENTLNYINVHPGEVYFIPAGQVHALGAGVVLAEIQQSSNVTYRVYDYGRRQADGSLRQLHTKKAADVTRIMAEDEIESLRFSRGHGDESTIAWCEYFKVAKCDINGAIALPSRYDTFTSILCLDGSGEIVMGGESYPVLRGDSYYIPAGAAECSLNGNASVIITTLN